MLMICDNVQLKHLCPLEMKLICLTLLIISEITVSRTEQYEVLGAVDAVLAVAGEDVILPCSVEPNISVVDMRVEWFRLDLEDSQVHLYDDHEDKNTQRQSYRGRTILNHQELERGNASLKLSSVQVSDEGLYKCFIQSKSWSDDATVNVNVEAVGRPPVITVDGFDHSGGLHLLCESEGWNPEPDLEWLNSEGVSLRSETTETHRNADGFNVKHTIIVHERDSKIHCRFKLKHHMLETLIISSSNMFNSWRTSVIVISVLVVLSVILVAVFAHKNKECIQLRNEHSYLENEHSQLQNEKRRIHHEREQLLECLKTLIHIAFMHLTTPTEREQLLECLKTLIHIAFMHLTTPTELDQLLRTILPKALIYLRSLTVNVILDADTAHPRLIVSDDGKQPLGPLPSVGPWASARQSLCVNVALCVPQVQENAKESSVLCLRAVRETRLSLRI
ncbi:hypothetical protein QQF64_025703 [Cirrhinus molitorella]|uniref:Ig-like domain-containing protein n=1 Tax=Cirrhinus molitorella TaxID=172907 RepID=A0ABR3NPQ1_9TELE